MSCIPYSFHLVLEVEIYLYLILVLAMRVLLLQPWEGRKALLEELTNGGIFLLDSQSGFPFLKPRVRKLISLFPFILLYSMFYKPIYYYIASFHLSMCFQSPSLDSRGVTQIHIYHSSSIARSISLLLILYNF